MQEIKTYFKTIKKNNQVFIQCVLCPHNCIIIDGKVGLCKTRKNINNKFYSLVYGYPCSIHIDPIEKKPLYHFYPKEKILSFGTIGCNLFCKGCQNFDISRADANKTTSALKKYTPQDIVALTKKHHLHMIAYTYNEPTIFFEYMLDTAKLAKKNDIHNVIVSNGFINKEPLKELLKYIDAANIDIKGFTEAFYKNYCHATLADVKSTIQRIVAHNKKSKHKVHLELTNLIIPGQNDNFTDIKKMCTWIASLDKNIPLHFSRFFPYYEASNMQITPIDTLQKAKEIAEATGLTQVYLGNV